MNKDFMIWYYSQKTPFVTYEQVYETYKEETNSIYDSLKPYFDVTKEKNIKLNNNYAIGHVQVKKSIAFLLMLDEKDLKIDLFDLKGAMENDLVLVNRSSIDPYVIEVLKYNLTMVIAEVRKKEKLIRFDATNAKDKLIIVDNIPDFIVDGHVVTLDVKKITQTKIYADFKEVIGHKNDPDMEIVKIIYEYGWPLKFSKEILKEVSEIKVDEVYERKTRTDLSNKLIVTIDGEDAKDLDDAISLEKLDNGNYLLGVHIADVSYFVREETKLNEEAYLRSTSVYLADRVIPMIPHAISNDLCSLNPHEAKYTLTCEMELDDAFDVISHKIFASIIESKQRLTYTAVNKLLKENVSVGNKEIDDMLIKMNEISKILKIKRSKRGAIDFDSIELKFKLDHEGKVLEVIERKTDDAEMLIESFMILANETVAKHFYDEGLSGIYRVHEKPDAEKLETALLTLRKLGFYADKNQKSTAKILQKLTKESTDTKYGYIIHMILLRSMQKAKYSEKPIGHFGLGSEFYSHFTSPIRRYPDLLLHRMIRELMLTNQDEKTLNKKINYFKNHMNEYAEHTSKQERTAINMERDVVSLKSAEYMSNFIGKTFEALIIQMMPSGFFVKIPNGIEGFVSVRNVNQYLIYDEENLLFYTDRGRRYRLGDTIKVKLIAVDTEDSKIDFTIFSNKDEKAKDSKKKETKHKSQKNKTNKRRR
ncbi:ribonuclease R [Acholeplasma hippikon]|uniref:Ribonuclease R n=1 Tax=Acholeplasma hippikon TaxID=264636 RepID=A0A449BJF9_9MOLU|nr:ribonuclease R [Acholeplasma hippikon]VEU82601.1 exoribonuclease II [Acholeplasma hippikon]